MASVNPLSPKLVSSRLAVVTIVTRPKSFGDSSRARTTVADNWTPNASAWESTDTPALWTPSWRTSLPSMATRNAPLASNGFKVPPHGASEAWHGPKKQIYEDLFTLM